MFELKLRSPPVGDVEVRIDGTTSLYIKWAPGNGLVYNLIVTPVSGEIGRMVGGRVLLSLGTLDGRTFLTYPGNPDDIYHLSFVEEKWGKHLGEEGTHYCTALLNWALFDEEIADQYAMEIFGRAKEMWKW